MERVTRINEEIKVESGYDEAYFGISYKDPECDYEKKSLIEALIKRTLDEADRIMSPPAAIKVKTFVDEKMISEIVLKNTH